MYSYFNNFLLLLPSMLLLETSMMLFLSANARHSLFQLSLFFFKLEWNKNKRHMQRDLADELETGIFWFGGVFFVRGVVYVFVFLLNPPNTNSEQTLCKLEINWVILALNDLKAIVEDLFKLLMGNSTKVSYE